MQKSATILFGHGSRDPEWAAPMHRVRQTVLAKSPELRVELAFLEFIQPDLCQCAELLVQEGFNHIVVLPMFIAQGGHLRRDVPMLLDELRQRYPEVSFSLSCAAGEAELVVQAMAAHVLSLVSH